MNQKHVQQNSEKREFDPKRSPGLLENAQNGDTDALGQLLSSHQAYLRVLARVEVGRRLQGKLDASDIVQQTFLEANKSFPSFNGNDENQFAKWIRSILAHTIANTVRRYFGTQARDLKLEQQLAADIDRSAMSIGGMLAAPGSSPSQHVARVEQTELVIRALSRLPPDYESVLIFRHLEGLTFPEIAERMTKSVNAVEKLWIRGVTRLKKEFANRSTRSEKLA